MSGENGWSDPNPQDRMIWALRRADIAIQAVKERALRPLGLASAHYALLAAVHDESGLAGAELARRLNVTPQAVASLVSRLELRGYLERRPHPRHRHVQELHLTVEGLSVFSKADEVISGIERDSVEALGAEDSVVLTMLLNRVVASASEMRARAAN